MWYYDNFLESSDISVSLIHNTGRGAARLDPDTGILTEIPRFSVNHEWKDAGWGGGIGGTIINSLDYSLRSSYRQLEKATVSTSSDRSQKIQPNSNILKEFDGTSVDFNIPTFNKLFLCDTDKTNTRDDAVAFIEKHKLFGEIDYRDSNFIQNAPGDFQYEKNFDVHSIVQGSFAIVSPKFIIRNLVPQSVSITQSDNLIYKLNCPLYIKIEINFVFAKLVTSDVLLKYLKREGG